MKEKRGLNKKGQLTIFIILGILILIILIVIFMRNDDLRSYFTGKSPVEEIKECIRGPIEEKLEILRYQGGAIEPENYYLYEDNKLDYACYTDEEYKTCVVQKPILKNSIEKELKDYTEKEIISCIGEARDKLRGKGYEVAMKESELRVEIFPNTILVEVDVGLTLSKGDNIDSYGKVSSNIPSRMYDFVMIATSIIQWETRYGDSEVMNYMLYYPSIKVEKKKQGDGTTIYIISDFDNPKETFMFASKSFVVPPGLI